jgi:PAS domain S-box-containing protein
MPPEPAHLLRARERIRDYLRLYCTDEQLISDVVLCVDEAVANAVSHSGSELDVELSLGFEKGSLVADVRDHGSGFDITTFDSDALPDPQNDHGRGLFIISQLMDSLELHLDGGLGVRMTRCAASCAEPSSFESGLGGALDSRGHHNPRMRAVLEEIDEGFTALDWEYRYAYVNEVMLRLLGKRRDEVLGKVIWELLPQLEDAPLAQHYREAMELGKPSVNEHRSVVTGDWLEVRVYPTQAGISIYFREINERKRTEQELIESRAALATTLAAITDGFYTLDRLWRVTYLNDAAAELFPGGKDAVGANFWELFPEAVGSDFETNKRAAMEHGEFRLFDSYYPPFDSWFEERDYPSADGITVLFTDITERQRAADALRASEERLRAVGEIASVITTLLEPEEILDAVVPRAGVAMGAESATMCSLEGEGWVPRHLWNVPDEVLDVPIPLEQVRYASEASETRKAVAIDDCETDLRVDIDLQHAWGVRSVLTVPLVVHGKVVGALFFNHSRQHIFTEPEIDFASRVADLVSGMLESARLYKIQRRVAETLQENFVHDLPQVPGLEIDIVSSRAFASDLVGGDFGDLFLLDDSHVVVLIGDVAGKGVRAAGHTETVRATARAFAMIDSSPAYILGKVNELLRLDPSDPHVTLFCALLDPTTGQLTYASAGHPAPVHLGAFACRPLAVSFGLPLGLYERPYTNSHAMLTPEEYLVLYTDGVTEARRDGEMFGETRLLETVDGLRGRSPQEVAEGVRDAVLAFSDRLRDDLQLIVLRLA